MDHRALAHSTGSPENPIITNRSSKYVSSFTTDSNNSSSLPTTTATTSMSFLSSSPTDVLFAPLSPPPLLRHGNNNTDPPSPWPIFPMSQKAQRTQNPIRVILDPILQKSSRSQSNDSNSHSNHENNDKKLISLALGDPVAVAETASSSWTHPGVTTTTPTPHLLPCPHAIRAVLATLSSGTAAASYTNAIGTIEGRRAIAKYHSHPPYCTYNPDTDVIIANGCSGALELVLTSLLDPPPPHPTNPHQQNHSILLVPSPGFPLYRVIAESHGAMVLSYPLLPHRQWEVDLVQLQNILEQHQQPFYDHRTGITTTTTTAIRGIVINNPSNPTGAVYTTAHLQQIVRLCQQYYIPIIADEIYGDLIFPNGPVQNHNHHHNIIYIYDAPCHTPTFVSMAQIAAQMGRIVPVITASGIGKQFLLPGWRIGWICFQDNIYGSLQQVRDGAKRLAQVILGASHLAQVAIPALLLTPPVLEVNDSVAVGNEHGTMEYRRSYYELMEWKNSVRNTIYEQSRILCLALQRIGPCVQVIEPQGAMYAMVRINLEYFDTSMIRNDIDFTKLLYQEENVVVLPGTCFDFPNSFRVVFCAPVPILQEAAHRIHLFCHRHFRY